MMSEVLIFAGTTEGRQLSEALVLAGVAHTVCVATEYGEVVLKEHPLVSVHTGRMDEQTIRNFISEGKYRAIVDATHPYAQEVTKNIQRAKKDMDIAYFRLKREEDETQNISYENIVYCSSKEACIEALQHTDGNILLTTGSKELVSYCVLNKEKERLFVRVLPAMESLQICKEQGITANRILALQGPFSVEMNEAMLKQYKIRYLVTKQSGKAGGYQEKIEAAKRQGVFVYVIGRPKETEGVCFKEVYEELLAVLRKEAHFDVSCLERKKKFYITLAGVGMGSSATMTKETTDAIKEADVLFGAERMVAPYEAKLGKKAYYKAEQIVSYLEQMQQEAWSEEIRKVVVLFSGDSGFYSGAFHVYQAIQESIKKGTMQAEVCIVPGISSVSYLASRIGISYQDADICSMHGKKLYNLANRIRRQSKTFLLMSGLQDLHTLGKLLQQAKLHHCIVWAGCQLSYPEEQVCALTPEMCVEKQEEGLYTCCVVNPTPQKRYLTHGKKDADFIRGKVPMTKEEVRAVSICKLKLYDKAVVYDIGSGTGSIAVEMAALSDRVQVYAIEQKEEAVSLIKQNQEKFGLENIHVVLAKAPDGFEKLPVPTHAFIGGSSGNMKEILNLLYQKNPNMYVEINAISMETICQIKEILETYPICEEDVVQLQVSRSKKVGTYHLMQAENPVWICTFQFCEKDQRYEDF